MDTAFETETKKLVKAWVIGRDTSYIMPENDIFITNKDEIVNYDEKIKEHNLEFIECRFRKGHLRTYQNGKSSVVVPHFFIPNKSKLGVETLPESPEHKKIKSFIYDYFFNNPNLELTYSKYIRKNETIFNKTKIKDLDINWDLFTLKKEDLFEVGVTDTFNTRRVDCFLKFNKFNALYGEGIVIEVQLSPQTIEKTKERTIDRGLKGYSCIWINKSHFEDVKEDKLILNKEIFIESWQSILHNNADNIEKNLYNKIQTYSRDLDMKFENIKKELQILIGEKNKAVGTLCPQCRLGILLYKKNSINNKRFIACSNYPKCKFTGDIE